MQTFGGRIEAAVFDHRGGCRFSNCVADGDVSTSSFAEFSSKWRTVVSHLRGGS
jgi:hypothetical protein